MSGLARTQICRDCDAYTAEGGCICPWPMSRAELVERILFAVDGYRLGEWSIGEAAARITAVIEQHPEALSVGSTEPQESSNG